MRNEESGDAQVTGFSCFLACPACAEYPPELRRPVARQEEDPAEQAKRHRDPDQERLLLHLPAVVRKRNRPDRRDHCASDVMLAPEICRKAVNSRTYRMGEPCAAGPG